MCSATLHKFLQPTSHAAIRERVQRMQVAAHVARLRRPHALKLLRVRVEVDEHRAQRLQRRVVPHVLEQDLQRRAEAGQGAVRR